MLRRTSRQAYRDMTKSCGKASIKLYDSKDQNILKTRRWRNRLMITKNNISYLGELSMETLEWIFTYVIVPMIGGFIGAIIVGTLKKKK